MTKKRSTLERIFVPQYDELALFLMGCAFILLFITRVDLQEDSLRIVFDDLGFRSVLVLVFFVLGIAFSLYHVFTPRPKTDLEKSFMLFFAVLVNGFSGIAAGMHVLENSRGLLAIFPFWNFVNGVLLFVMYRFDIIDESSIIDDNAGPLEVVAGLLVVVTTFAVGTFIFDLYWALVFSMCVAYASNINTLVRDFVAANFR